MILNANLEQNSDNLVNNLSKILANYALMVPSEVIEEQKKKNSNATDERIIGLLRDTKEAIFKIQTTHNLLFDKREARTMASQKKQKHAQRTNRLAAKIMGISSHKERSIGKKTRQNPLKIIPPCESRRLFYLKIIIIFM